MRIITHKNLQPYLNRLQKEPEFRPGPAPIIPDAWYRQRVILEIPMGELAKDGLTTMALCGLEYPDVVPLTGKEGFAAQGLEGKAQITKDLFGALMNMRDLIPANRGRIVLA